MDSIHQLVWSGFYSPERILEIVTEELYAPGELDADEVACEVGRQFEAKAAAETNWPLTTDCDRLDALFDVLNRAGLAAIQNAGYTMSDGFEDVDEICRQRGGPGPHCFGFCFYHGQDLERAMDGAGLTLAFGDFSGKKEAGVKVGQLVRDYAEKHGFRVDWDGSFGKRILLPDIDWKKRSDRA
jgi:hypothetical protein